MSDLITRSMRFKRAEKPDVRAVDVIASDETLDSYGEIVEASWDLERYAANPVVLYAHDSYELPIGRAESVRVENGQLLATLHFVSAEANPKAEQVWQLICEGALRAVSVGFYPRTVRYEMRDDREVCVLADNELREISVVPVPANPNALAQLRARAAGSRSEVPPMSIPVALLVALSLPQTATAEEATAAAERHKREREAMRAVVGRDTHDEAVGAVEAYKAAHAALPGVTAERDALAKKVEGYERTALLVEAHRERKIAALDLDPSTERGAKLAAMPLASLRTHLELAVPMLPTGEPLTQGKGAGDEGITLTDDELRLANKMGQDPAELLASKKAHAAAQRAAGR